ncbi:hypothetical protein ACHQM5_025726 [Ranunculus cassubicifolius]
MWFHVCIGVIYLCFTYLNPDFNFCLYNNGRYLAELMAERQKLGPFMQILPLCNRLLNQGWLLQRDHGSFSKLCQLTQTTKRGVKIDLPSKMVGVIWLREWVIFLVP